MFVESARSHYLFFPFFPSASVTLVLEMPILDVTLSNLPDPVTADVTYDVLCQV